MPNSTSSARLDPASLRGQDAGSETRYTIAVRGPADEHWADAYLAVQSELRQTHRCFRLDPRSRTIAFACPTVEGPAFVFEMLERLEELLELADRRAATARSMAASAPPPLRPIA